MVNLSLDFGCNLIEPCCGHSLETGARIIAIINLVLTFWCFCIFGTVFLLYLANAKEVEGSAVVAYFDYNLKLVFLGRSKTPIVLTIYILGSILLFILARYLQVAVRNRDKKSLSRWCKISTFLLILQILSLCTEIFRGLSWILSLLEMVYLGYTIWVVWSFKRQVVLERRIERAIRSSTENTRLQRPLFFTRV